MLVLVISTPVIVISRKMFESTETAKVSKDDKDSEYPGTNLIRVSYIQYPITFWKKSVSVLFNFGSKVNIIHPTFAKEPRFPIRPTDVGVQKIDSTMLDTYKIVVLAVLMTNKVN